MSSEFPTIDNADQLQLKEDAVIEAGSILHYAEQRLDKLNSYLENTPLLVSAPPEQFSELRDLWQVFRNTGIELEETHTIIIAGADTDLASELVKIRTLENKMKEDEKAVYAKAHSFGIPLPEDEMDTVPDPLQVPQETGPEVTKPTNYLEEDVLRLKQMDPGILYQDGDNSKSFKDVRELGLDIEAIFKADGQSENSINSFFNARFNRVAGRINRDVKQLRRASPDQRLKINKSVKASYEQILKNAAVWLRNAEVYGEGGSETIPDRGVIEIQEDIRSAEQSFQILQEQNKNNPNFTESDAYKSVQIILQEIKNNPVTDPNLLNETLENHLNNLGDALDKLFMEAAGDDTFDGVFDELSIKKSKSETLPIAPEYSSDMQRKLEPLLNEFDKYKNLSVYYQLRETEEFKNALINAEVLKKGVPDGDALSGEMFIDSVIDIFTEQLEALRKKGDELEMQALGVVKGKEETVLPNIDADLDKKREKDFQNGVEVIYLDEIPEDQKDLENKKLALLDEFEVYKNLPAESGLRKTKVFTRALNEAALLSGHALNPDDLEKSKNTRNGLTETFAARLEALRRKADELGPIRVLFDDDTSPATDDLAELDIDLDKIEEEEPLRKELEQYLEKEKNLLLKDFEEYSTLPAESQLRKSEEFILATSAAENLRNHTMHLEDVEGSKYERADLAHVLVERLQALRKRAEQLGPIRVMFASERDIQREKSNEAKLEFRDIKKQYHAALEVQHHELKNRSLWEKLKLLGIKPTVPEAMKALEAEYLARRKDYARELDARLSQRGEKFELSQDDMKRAFTRKFILKPNEELLKLQESNLLSPEAKATMRRISAKLKEHKTALRVGTVLFAGGLAALSGAGALAVAGAAGWQGIKIVGVGLAGAGAAGATNVVTQGFVDRASAKLNKSAADFTVEGMNKMEPGVLKNRRGEALAEKIQMGATVGVGVATGFAAGDYIADNAAESAAASAEVLETSKIVPRIVEDAEVPPLPVFIKEIVLSFEKPDRTMSELKVKELTLGPDFKPAALSEPETKALADFIKLKVGDFHAPNTNISESNLEKLLQAAVEKKFSGASWWAESPVKSIDLDLEEIKNVTAEKITPVLSDVEKKETLDSFRTTGPLSVEADADIKSVPISVVEKSVPAHTEVIINNARTDREAVPTKPAITVETKDAKGFYETAPQQVRDEIRQYFNNPSAFEASVKNAAYMVEQKTYDITDTQFFTKVPQSPFLTFRDYTLDQFRELAAKPREGIIAELKIKSPDNHKLYEAFTEHWVDEVNKLAKMPHTSTTTIGELFEQKVLQEKIEAKNNSYRNP